ncbi:MAG: beta-propeller fold lactonase family protein [Polyangiaceae bacterium]|nr:beta-propeller fold lactonase family protein [Polyangiaceae bacterium]
MRRLGTKPLSGGALVCARFAASSALFGRGYRAFGAFLVLLVSAAGCGDESETATSTSTTASSGGDGGSGGSGGGGAGGQGGGSSALCVETAPGPTRGSAIAISPDDTRIAVVNRDVGTVTVIAVAYGGGQPELSKAAEIDVGGEPSQVAIDACGDRAYVALRRDQKVVEIKNLRGDPALGTAVDVGSEPTGLALTPNNKMLYVANWIDGTLSVIDVPSMTKTGTLDLNKVLAATGLLGDVASRPSLAHPRSVAITNDGDADDADETVFVTEFFAQRTAAESADGKNADINKKGLVYAVSTENFAVSTIGLGAIADTGQSDHNGQKTGCFPNQLQGITIAENFAYIPSICASPAGPLGVFVRSACSTDADCGGVSGACDAISKKCECTAANQAQVCGAGATCNVPAGQQAGSCNVNVTNVKTTTHPAIHVIDIKANTEVMAGAAALDTKLAALYEMDSVPDDASRRLPHIANDIAFDPSGAAYLSANGADAVFRAAFDPGTGAFQSIATAGGPYFIDLASTEIASASLRGLAPIGIAAAHKQPFAFTANDVSRNVTAVDLAKQAVAGLDGAMKSPRVIESSAQPSDPAAQAVLRGKRLFNTGLGRWSLKGQAWGSCQACHIDGLTDNVTWYFARGPRQSTSLDGSFASDNPADQRIFNWTAILDEIADFEANTRVVSGGVGALVTVTNSPPKDTDQINLATQGHAGLNGSAKEVTDTLSTLKDWNDILAYIQSIRSPRAPRNLDPALVAEGKTLFEAQGSCGGCHGGPKWTISTRFYTPSKITNTNLLSTPWDAAAITAAGFPSALLPASTPANQLMRFGGQNPSAFDQIQCILRPVGTYNVAPMAVGIAERRSDMQTTAQGNETDGKGYNPPSLLNLAAGAPYFHAGNARTLEEAFSKTFAAHYASPVAASGFLSQMGDIDKLVAFLLSIDETKLPVPIPPVGPSGGDFCTPLAP